MQTIGSGIVVGFLQGLAGMTVDPSNMTLIVAIDTAGPIVLSKVLGSLTGTSTAIATPAPAAAAGSSGSPGSPGSASSTAGTWSPGFTVTPAFPSGNTPFAVTLAIVAGNNQDGTPMGTCGVDWQDGSPTQLIALTAGKGIATHTYTFVQTDPHYTGHAYFPAFTLILNDGTTRTFNTAAAGRCCAVDVSI